MTSKYSVSNAKLTDGKFNHAKWYPLPPSGPPTTDQLPPLPKEDTNRAQYCPPPPPGTPPSADQLTPKPVSFCIGFTSGVAQPDSSTQDNQKFTSSSHNQRITTGTTAFEKREMPFDGTSPVSSSEDISDPPPPGEADDPVCPLSKSPAVPEGKTVKPLMPWRRSSSHSTQSQSSEPEGENRSVYVGKLNPITTSDSLRKTFSKYGTVIESRVIVHRTGSIKLCYGFVTYSNRSDAEKAIAETNGMYLESRTIRTNWALRSCNYNQTTNETNQSMDYDNVYRSKNCAQSSSFSSAANEELMDKVEVADPDTSKDEDAHSTPRDSDEPTVSSSQVEAFPFPPTSKLFSVYDVKAHSVVGPLSDLSDLSTLDVIDEIRAAKAWSQIKSARLNDANVYVIQFSPRSRIAEEIHSLYFNHLDRAEKIGVVRTSSVVDFFYIVPLAKSSRLPPVLTSILPYRVLRTIKERTSNLLLGILTRGTKYQRIMTRRSSSFR